MTVGRREQSVITDFDKILGQDVLEETTNKLLSRESREFDLIGSRILEGESDLTVGEREDAVVGDGDAKDVRGEIFEGCFSTTNRLTMNDPIFEPDLLVEEVEEVGLLQLVAELGAEEDREGLDVDEEIRARVKPMAIGRESAPSGDVVDVRMVEEVAGPGMKHTNHADTGADEARICG
jgi:hypothetical protein